MGGPSAHGQHNKAHKAGPNAGRSAREKQKLGKEGAPVRVSVKASTANSSKAERARAAQQFRDAKRHELLEKRRRGGPPIVVAILPLSDAVETAALWGSLTAACDRFGQQAAGSSDVEMATVREPQGMLTLCAAGRARLRLTLLPALQDRQDLLAVVDLGKAADVVLLAVAGGEGLETVDAEGEAALGVLRALGMPGVLGVVQGSEVGKRDMRERAAAKKRAEKALGAQISGDVKVMHMDGPDDASALVRHLAEAAPTLPLWRQHRASLLIEAADFAASSEDPMLGTLRLCGFVRSAGLSANGLLLLPGAGDFQIAAIEGPQDPHVTAHASRGKGGVMEVEMGGDAGAVPVLAVPSPDLQDAVVRENVPDSLANEQTWPTDEELADADVFQRGKQRKRVPAGTSEYQAAWILDDDDEEEEEGEGEGEDDEGDAVMGDSRMACDDGEPPELATAGDGDAFADDDDDFDARTTGTTAMEEELTEGEAVTDRLRAEFEAIKRKRHAEVDDEAFPDEVDTPIDVAARVRFQRYRGLKSFRTSPWDPKEGLPEHYARVFAFENFKRAQRRAREAAARANSGADPCAVAPGTYVRVVVAGVSADKAAALLARVMRCLEGCGPPVVAFGLLQHESRLSVLNASLHKASSYQQPIANKEEMLFVTGIRSFLANPLYSSDDLNANKHRMERFLRAGQHAMASVIAPISYPPLPLLAFKMVPGQHPRLAATGAVRSCEPDRVVVKKIVLSGYPVRVHKKKATVRFMFHNADDIRWFQKLDLWTKHGRRGRIVESLGTHGAMKCSFDGVIIQQDSVCASLYKRVFPKWPKDMTFA